jgi:hypothetical protein
MLQDDDDWVHLKKQHEVFRSKPVLTFWLIGGERGRGERRGVGGGGRGGVRGQRAA